MIYGVCLSVLRRIKTNNKMPVQGKYRVTATPPIGWRSFCVYGQPGKKDKLFVIFFC